MERRLAAVLVADMAGYSRLMAADETGTIARHKSHRREQMDPAVARHGGRIVKATGDGLLAEFPSVVHAVQAAVEIQNAVAGREAQEAEERRIRYRIGVNLGDIVLDEGDIFGDGVNVAARLEQLAGPGEVYVSDVVYQSVKTKVEFAFELIGLKSVKNIPGEITVYRVRPDSAPAGWRAAPSREKPLLPTKPSVAVLPFANMSSDREQDFFADGITEDLITALSRIRELFVISRTSSFVYKGRSVRLEDVARELGVRFILEGSVRVAGKRLRVTAQLIEGESGAHVWAELFDAGSDDIFDVQDEITRQIALALQVKLTYGELARLWEGQTRSLRAWEKMVAARDLFLRFTVSDNRSARRLLEEALAIDPDYTGARVLLGLTHWWEARFDAGSDKERSLRLAEQQAQAVLASNPDMGAAHMLGGGVAFLRDRHDEAVALCRRAVELVPGDSWAHAFCGLVCIYAGEAQQAVAALKTAMRLSPHYPTWYTYNFATANIWAGDLAAAQEAAHEFLREEPGDPFAYVNLATVYAFQGRDEEAVRTISDLRSRFPEFGMREVILSQRYKERQKLERILGALRQAGLSS